MAHNIECQECGKPATFIVWGCCDYYRAAMCGVCAMVAMGQQWGAETFSCDPTDTEDLNAYMIATGGYGFN